MSGMSRLRLLAAAGVMAAVSASAVAAQQSTSPTRPPSGGQLPSGSYQQTCRGANLNGNMLSAQCTGPISAPIFSSIDTNGRRGRDIANDRGYLRCGGGGGGGPRPPEPPRPLPPVPPRPIPPRPEPPRPPVPGNFSVTVYTGADYTGRSMTIREPLANFGNFYGFNDNIRSVQVQYGRAQICTDSRYNGHCVTISQSYRDLHSIRMGNTISSIR